MNKKIVFYCPICFCEQVEDYFISKIQTVAVGPGLHFYIVAARFGAHHSFFGKLVQRVAELP